MAVKKNIEEAQGKESYPCGLQLLIYSGKVLKDESTLEENNINEEGFLVVMLSKVLYLTLIVDAFILQHDTYVSPPYHVIFFLCVAILEQIFWLGGIFCCYPANLLVLLLELEFCLE